MSRPIWIIALLLFGAAAGAAELPIPHRFKPNQFDQVMDLIEQEMAPGGVYAEVAPQDQDSVRVALARMAKLLEGHDSISELSEEQKVALLNDQEQVNAILTGNKKDQLQCQRRDLPGTRLKQSVCETKGDAVTRRDQSRQEVRELQKKAQPTYGN